MKLVRQNVLNLIDNFNCEVKYRHTIDSEIWEMFNRFIGFVLFCSRHDLYDKLERWQR